MKQLIFAALMLGSVGVFAKDTDHYWQCKATGINSSGASVTILGEKRMGSASARGKAYYMCKNRGLANCHAHSCKQVW